MNKWKDRRNRPGPATLKEVKEIVMEEFEGANVDGISEEQHRIVGYFFWDGFQEKDVAERSRLVSERVRDSLGLRGLNVGILLPLAPGENKPRWKNSPT